MKKSIYALGKAVRETRKYKQLTQEELAERVGVCKRTIIDIENNTGNPKFGLLYALVRELDLPLYQVFYPEMEDKYELKNTLMREVSDCSEYEIKIILSVVRDLRRVLKKEREMPFQV